jgi:hypothetical protein
MALLKRIYTEDNTGVYAEYWKISEINSNWLTDKIEIVISGFFDEASRRNNKNPLLKKTVYALGDQARIYFSAISMQPEGIDIIQEAYNFTKLVDLSFADAVDVLE